MPALADLERLLERVFERTTTRLFRARLQVVQVERKVERAMERARTQQGAWTVVPSRYRVRLNPDDLTGLAEDAGGADQFAARLADAALAFARSHGYHLSGRPSVAIVADPSVERAAIEVDAVADVRRPHGSAGAASAPVESAVPMPADRFAAPDVAEGPAAGLPFATGHDLVPDMPAVASRATPSVDGAAPILPSATPMAGTGAQSGRTPQEPASSGAVPVAAVPVAPMPGPVPAPDAAPASSPTPSASPSQSPSTASGSIRREGTETLVFRKPAPPETRAILRVTAPDGKERLLEVGGAPLTLGRSTDNGLVLADSRVSRHHGRLQTRRGTLVYTDLGSTNGSRVNGVRVDECALGMGDRIVVGDSVLLVEQLPG